MLDPVPQWSTNAERYEGICVHCDLLHLPQNQAESRSPGALMATRLEPGRMEPWWVSISIAPLSTEVLFTEGRKECG